MEHEQTLARFFEYENGRDWENYRAVLHPQIEWVLFSADEQQSFFGIDAYMDKITAAYRDNNVTFECTQLLVSSDGKRIVARLENSHGETSVDVFEFKEGLIEKEYEFLM